MAEAKQSRSKRGPLSKADMRLLQELARALGTCIHGRLCDEDDDAEAYQAGLLDHLTTLRREFDHEGDEEQLWAMELEAFARNIVEHVLEQAGVMLRDQMGASVWSHLGLPKF